MYSDDELLALSKHEREDVLRRLTGLVEDVSVTAGRASRERFVAAAAFAAVFLVGWIAYLNETLPHTYTAAHWRLTWVGFDSGLALVLAATAVLAVLRLQLVILTSVVAGSLLICDSWFDATTAAGSDRWLSWASVPIETGLAAVLFAAAGVFFGATSRIASETREDRAGRSALLRPLLGVGPGGPAATLGAFRRR